MNIFNIILKGQIIKAKLGTKERYCHIDVILEMWADGIRIEKKSMYVKSIYKMII